MQLQLSLERKPVLLVTSSTIADARIPILLFASGLCLTQVAPSVVFHRVALFAVSEAENNP
jgi:hypothetical protein